MSAVLVTIILYKVALLAVGWLAERRNRDASGFFLGSRGLGPLVAAISASASSSSVWTLIGVSGFAFTDGLVAVWLLPACVGGFALNWFVLAPRLRRATAATGVLTVSEYLGTNDPGGSAPLSHADSRRIRAVASVIVLVSLMTYVATQFQGAGVAFESLLGFGRLEAILLGSLVVVVYTVLGGFWAVSVTDTIQGLMMAAAAITLPLAAVLTVGGPGGVASGLSDVARGAEGAADYATLFPGGLGTGSLAALALLGIGLGYPGQPHVVNRIMALRDDRALRQARAISIAWATTVYTGMVTLGWSVRILSERASAGFTEITRQHVLYGAAEALLPPVVAGVAIAATLSAIMSTADSQLLVAASAVDHDLRGRVGTGGETPGAQNGASTVLLARLTVFGLAAAAVVAALVIEDRIFNSVLFAWTAMGAAFGPLLLVRLFAGPVNAAASLAAMLLGAGLAVAAYAYPPTKGTAAERVVPFVVAGLVAWAGCTREANRHPNT